jgi:hypothetical protein
VDFERDIAARDVFEPIRDVILLFRLNNRRSEPACTKDNRDHQKSNNEDQVKKQKTRAIKAQDSKTEDGLDNRSRAVDKQLRNRLLDGQNVKEAVNEFRNVLGAEAPGTCSGKYVGDLHCIFSKDSLLNRLNEVELHHLHDTAHKECAKDEEGQDYNRLNEETGCD